MLSFPFRVGGGPTTILRTAVETKSHLPNKFCNAFKIDFSINVVRKPTCKYTQKKHQVFHALPKLLQALKIPNSITKYSF